jgi:hypothetical protein
MTTHIQEYAERAKLAELGRQKFVVEGIIGDRDHPDVGKIVRRTYVVQKDEHAIKIAREEGIAPQMCHSEGLTEEPLDPHYRFAEKLGLN